MGYPIPRIATQPEKDLERHAADRIRLFERVAIGLAHEGKNPLHNMVLHLQLMAEELKSVQRAGDSRVEKHILALRDGIGRVDALLRSFGEFAAPEHVPPDLAAAARRAIQLFAYDVRRATVQIEQRGPQVLMVDSDCSSLGDLVAHAMIASIEFARDGGRVEVILEKRGPAAVMGIRADGGLGNREQALPYLDAARRLAPEAACDLSIETPAAGGARLSLSFPHPR